MFLRVCRWCLDVKKGVRLNLRVLKGDMIVFKGVWCSEGCFKGV